MSSTLEKRASAKYYKAEGLESPLLQDEDQEKPPLQRSPTFAMQNPALNSSFKSVRKFTDLGQYAKTICVIFFVRKRKDRKAINRLLTLGSATRRQFNFGGASRVSLGLNSSQFMYTDDNSLRYDVILRRNNLRLTILALIGVLLMVATVQFIFLLTL